MSASNNRASLLSGLRTGGVRSASGPIPHTAAPGGSFQVPRFNSSSQANAIYDDEGEGHAYGQTLQYNGGNPYGMPMTAGFVDSRSAPRFQSQHAILQQQQQQLLMQAQLAAMGGMNLNPMDPTQMLQIQMMQMALQQQQQQQQQQTLALQQAVINHGSQLAARSANNRIPNTAGPTQSSFDVRSNAVAQLRNSRLHPSDDQDDYTPMPMTAALGGKFGSRSAPTGLNPHAATFKLAEGDTSVVPQTPSSTVVASGGVTLGAVSTPTTLTAPTGPSKSDSAVSWRRGSAPALPLSTTNGRVSPPKPVQGSPPSPPKVTISGPDDRKPSPPLSKGRPQPLRFTGNSSSSVSIESDGPTASDNEGSEAKKYEGVGIGRPSAAGVNNSAVRVSQPVRQPRGPPAGAEDLGARNFASRIRNRQVAPTTVVHAPGTFVVEAY